MGDVIATERLVLRDWTRADRAAYADMAQDREVMRFFANRLSRRQAYAKINTFQAAIDSDGYGFWAAADRKTNALLGVIGLSPVSPDVRCLVRGAPAIEIGWSLARAAWGLGLAPEAARACLDYAWRVLGAPEVVAFTAAPNVPSQRVMEKIGMVRDPDADFDHPSAPQDHPMRPHVLYRIANPFC